MKPLPCFVPHQAFLGILCAIAMAPTHAAEIAYELHFRYPANPEWESGAPLTGLHGYITIPGIPPTEGQLVDTKAEITTSLLVMNFGAENLSDSPVNLYARFSPQFSVPELGLSGDGSQDPFEIAYDVTAYDGLVDFAGSDITADSGYYVDARSKSWTITQPISPSKLRESRDVPADYFVSRELFPNGAFAFNLDPLGTSLVLTGKLQVEYSEISGTIFDDLNGNQILDPGEPTVPNCQVFLLRETGNSGTFPTPQDVIDSLFSEEFFGFPPRQQNLWVRGGSGNLPRL